MVDKITHQPQVLDLSFYAGDGLNFKLICTDSEDAPLNITGTVESQIRSDRGEGSDPLAEFDIDLAEAVNGVVLLSLTGEQTQDLMTFGKSGKFNGVWDVQWVPDSSEPCTLCQGKVECLADVTR